MEALVINTGSTSLKFTLFDTHREIELVSGVYNFASLVEFSITQRGVVQEGFFKEYKDVIPHIFGSIAEYVNNLEITPVVHRIVHGGGVYTKPTKITSAVYKKLRSFSNLAPLHQPPALKIVNEFRKRFPKVHQWGVFDTAFHSSLPEEEYLYGLPVKMQHEFNIRKYGFHGISHNFVSNTVQSLPKYPHEKVISVHLGGGCSVCAIQNGKSIGISMGMTPEEGLLMATRSGDIGVGVVLGLLRKGLTVDDVEEVVNTQSGLKGITGHTGDMKEILNHQDNKDYKLALDMYIEKAAEEIGIMAVKLNGVDTLVFTGGVGFGSKKIRDLILSKLSILGFTVAAEESIGNTISHQIDSEPVVLVIKTNEELQMLRDWKNMSTL